MFRFNLRYKEVVEYLAHQTVVPERANGHIREKHDGVANEQVL